MVKDIKKKDRLLTLDKPNIEIPNSSGNGEAIIRAPINGTKNLNNRVLKMAKNLFLLVKDVRNCKSSATLSLTNIKIIESPKTAPEAPKTTKRGRDVVSAKVPKTAIAGGVVNTEVKNIPATNTPIKLKPSKDKTSS